VRLVQEEGEVTYAPPLNPEMRRLNWELPAWEVAGWIRGLDPRPGAYTLWRGKLLRLFGARVKRSQGQVAPPGAAVRLHPQGLEIACGQGSVVVQELQSAGHKRLPAAEFLRGHALLKEILS
jgi:methionyl-tRNA formyltransferase